MITTLVRRLLPLLLKVGALGTLGRGDALEAGSQEDPTLHPAVSLPPPADDPSEELETLDGPRHWDWSSVEVEIEETIFCEWFRNLPSPGGESVGKDVKARGKLLFFSGNDYVGSSSHRAVRKAAPKGRYLGSSRGRYGSERLSFDL